MIYTQLIERYRPHLLDDLIGNENEVRKLKKFIKNNYIPNIIIEGEPGTGKTSAVLCFVREYLGEYFDTHAIELNASDDRGIDIVRSKVKSFAQKVAHQSKYKIIILDEADNMTQPAQLTLRRMIDQYNETTKFIFTCNNIEEIINQLQSRCLILHFGHIQKSDIIQRLEYISQSSNINITKDGFDAIYEIADNKNDVRQMINILELIQIYNDINHVKVDYNDVYRVCDKPSPSLINEIVDKIKTDDRFEEGLCDILNLKKMGFTNTDISQTLFNIFKNSNLINSLKICETIGNYTKIFYEGYESELQLASMVEEIKSNI